MQTKIFAIGLASALIALSGCAKPSEADDKAAAAAVAATEASLREKANKLDAGAMESEDVIAMYTYDRGPGNVTVHSFAQCVNVLLPRRNINYSNSNSYCVRARDGALLEMN